MGYKFLIKDVSAPNCRFNEAFTALLPQLCRTRGAAAVWGLGLGWALSLKGAGGAQHPLELRKPEPETREISWEISHPLGLPRFEDPRANPGSPW